MKGNTLLALAVGLVVGLVIGYFAWGSRGREQVTVAAAPVFPGSQPLPAAPPPGAADEAARQRIAMTQQIVARDPKNVQAWIGLGNDYFDTHQQQKAIEAYGKALELQPDNPDVLTDQGVMYREIGAFDKAIANFKKANQIRPSHTMSLYNLGVVYGYDLHDSQKAIEAWSRLVQNYPMDPQVPKARQAIEEMKQRSPR